MTIFLENFRSCSVTWLTLAEVEFLNFVQWLLIYQWFSGEIWAIFGPKNRKCPYSLTVTINNFILLQQVYLYNNNLWWKFQFHISDHSWVICRSILLNFSVPRTEKLGLGPILIFFFFLFTFLYKYLCLVKISIKNNKYSTF